ncbi:CIC11C00000003915 [Sungouiella intermedia]|uniref:CIC11C00000003915 n=1 Tax=Sungouiella intermedia TaxID=45354 RepID=A0A1L0C1S0_9ASCO|nr:CIC11C00000003915 [[Candida] intermedia]
MQLNRVACKECQRRKIKCSRQLPLCHQCTTHDRQCVYSDAQRTPLTRKHLNEVENDLECALQMLRRAFPDMDIDVAIQLLRSGGDFNAVIPVLLCTLLLKFSGIMSPELSSENMSSPRPKSMNILLLVDGPRIEAPVSGNVVVGLELRNFANSHNLQIPQFLPPSVDLSRLSSQMVGDRVRSPFASSPSKSYDWDERKLLRHDSRPTIIDGMATTVSNSYLGVTSSAALLNLVGVGYFLHPIQPELKDLEFLKMPERKILEENVTNYFSTYHISYPIVHKALFFAHFNEIVPPPPCWKSLLYIVAAIGSFMSATSAADHADLILFDRAKQNLSMEDWETGNLTLVQTLSLMSNYLQLRDRPNSGYNYLGIAMRMALGLGFHKNMDDSEIPLFDQEVRRRVWWGLYVFDCSQTITYGRPLGVSCNGVDTRLPLNIVDSSLTSSTTQVPKDEDLPTIYTSLRLQALFHLLTNGIYERIISEPLPSAQSLLEWDTQYIQRWKGMIPDYYRENEQVQPEYQLSHAVIHWRYRNLRIIIYRFFVLKRQYELGQSLQDEYEWRASTVCLEECRATLQNMDRFWKSKTAYNRMDAWWSLYFLIHAVMMPLVCLRNDPLSIEAQSWRNDVGIAKGIITKIMNICPPAVRILDLIEKVSAGCFTVMEEASATHAIPNLAPEEAPLSQLMQLHLMLWPDPL